MVAGQGLHAGPVGGQIEVRTAGDPPVHHLHVAVGADHDVPRLEVAVHDALGVGVADRLADLGERPQQAPQGPAVAAGAPGVGPAGGVHGVDDVAQGPPLDQLHREPDPTVFEHAGVEHRDDVGVAQARG